MPWLAHGERCQQAGLLPGDALDIAFTVDNNDHPAYGGLELSLRDFMRRKKLLTRPRPSSGRLQPVCKVVRDAENWVY